MEGLTVIANWSENLVLRDLGDGLILRRSTAQDADALADFNARIHSDDGPDHPNFPVGVWTHDLLARPHPTFSPSDFTLVEETASRRIVSSLNLISQTWSYEGIPFKVGRPELVGTLPEYRHRGLVRAQFDEVHRWSAQRGEMVQAITGIPYYYRLFGYEMALNLGGGRVGSLPSIPVLKDGETEPFVIRAAEAADLDFIAGLYARSSDRYLVSVIWDSALWNYELTGKSSSNVNRCDLRIIQTLSGERAGFLAHSALIWSHGVTMPVNWYEVAPGISWAAVNPSVMRYLKSTGEIYSARENNLPFGAVIFNLGEQHPVYELIRERFPLVRKPYAWYIRVPDLSGFIRHITPVLEARLAKSPLQGHTGELKITFYRSGLRLVFDKGRLVCSEGWKPAPQGHSGDAGFPGLTFLQLLFGYRSLEEIDYAFADCWAENDDISVLLDTLFPKRASDLWPVS